MGYHRHIYRVCIKMRGPATTSNFSGQAGIGVFDHQIEQIGCQLFARPAQRLVAPEFRQAARMGVTLTWISPSGDR
jgi:hypothetical protein